MKVAVFSTQPYDSEFFDRANHEGKHEFFYFQPSLNPDTCALGEGFEAICVFVNDQLNEDCLRRLAAKGLKMIALRCAGFNNVNLKVAEELGIKVARVPAYSPHAVAEHAVALILTLNRKTHKAYNRVREGNFSLVRLEGFDLYKKTVGVIGTGKIGRSFIDIMKGFGCRILAYDKYPVEGLEGVEYVELDTIYKESDIISLHCPLNEETQYLLNKEVFDKVKPGLMLINTSRGGLIDTQAAIHALKHKQLGYLGIDVYEQEEKLFFQDLSETIITDDLIARLMGFPNVLITAHQAFFTQNALTQIAETTLNNISAYEGNEPLVNEVKVA
ncbi:MAG: 2-hydroxyacid dehydrogenase [Bacteroidia bacterium]|nr:2-hydroxyacid dehydrogenase [Bacteroidia bacterium]